MRFKVAKQILIERAPYNLAKSFRRKGLLSKSTPGVKSIYFCQSAVSCNSKESTW